jgi:hypothetical protein
MLSLKWPKYAHFMHCANLCNIMLCFCCDKFCLIVNQPLDVTYSLGVCCFLVPNFQILFNCNVLHTNSACVCSSDAVASDDEELCVCM